MGVLAYNLLHMLRQFYLMGEEVKRSIEWLIKRLIKVGAKVAYHGRRWQVHVASAFPLALPSRVRVRTARTFRLTEEGWVRYAQKEENAGLIINVTTVLSSSGLLNDPPGSLQVVEALWRDRIPGHAPRNWQNRGIIPDEIC
jgi:hypothetical protein